MKRNPEVAAKMDDPKRNAVGLPIGDEGEFFVGGDGFMGQDKDDSIKDYNYPPANQPGLWCQWIPNEEGTEIEWDGGEKFYDYVEWLEYLICKFLRPWGYTLNGEVEWQGEERIDVGKIVAEDNSLRILQGKIDYEEIKFVLKNQ
jgi:hypothetical protein